MDSAYFGLTANASPAQLRDQLKLRFHEFPGFHTAIDAIISRYSAPGLEWRPRLCERCVGAAFHKYARNLMARKAFQREERQ